MDMQFYKMKTYIILILLFPLLTGCSLSGVLAGSKVDDSVYGDTEDPHKYKSQYMVEGLETDIEIIKAILHEPEKEPPFVVNDPCLEQNSVQVCSAKKGCWCEKNNQSGLNKGTDLSSPVR